MCRNPLNQLLVVLHVVAALALLHPFPAFFSAVRSRSAALCAASETVMATPPRSRVLPAGNLIVGYCNWNQCGDDSIVRAVQEGVNVVIWFAINLDYDPVTGLPHITNGPDWACVADTVQKINALGLATTHLISVGGWNSPHPDTTLSPDEYFAHWHRWNTQTVADPAKGFHGFDGLDWDVEGNDDVASPRNTFAPRCLRWMGRFSQRAKQAGYVVAMAPAESYLDPTTALFDLSLTHAYPEWSHPSLQPNFRYHGHNTYAFLLAFYGLTPSLAPDGSGAGPTDTDADDDATRSLLPPVPAGEEQQACAAGEAGGAAGVVSTFDFVTVLLYEGYSHAHYQSYILGRPAATVVADVVLRATAGWAVAFGAFSDVDGVAGGLRRVAVPPSRLVVGLANGWAGDGKFPLFYPDEVADAFTILAGETAGNAAGAETRGDGRDMRPRGCAFWNILDEGRAPPPLPAPPTIDGVTPTGERQSGKSESESESDSAAGESGGRAGPVWMAAGLNAFLRTR